MVKFGASQAAFYMLKAAFKNGKAEDRFSTSCSALYGAIHRLGRFDYSEIGHSLLKTDLKKVDGFVSRLRNLFPGKGLYSSVTN